MTARNNPQQRQGEEQSTGRRMSDFLLDLTLGPFYPPGRNDYSDVINKSTISWVRGRNPIKSNQTSSAVRSRGTSYFNLYVLRARLHGGGGPQVGELTRLGGVTRLSIYSLIWSPHLSCKRNQIKMRDYMDRRGLPHLSRLPHLP